jgi:hypothetical protein
MRWMIHILVIAGLLTCAGCDGNGSAQARGTSNHAAGIARIGVPF